MSQLRCVSDRASEADGWCDLPVVEDDCARVGRWIASLRKTSTATRQEAERHGPAWLYYDLSIASAAAQAVQADELSAHLNVVEAANRRWSL